MPKQGILSVLRELNLTDALVVAWVILAIVLGILLGREVHRLGQYGTSLNRTADALDQSANGLEIIAKVPLIGGRVGSVVDDLHATAVSIRESASRTQDAAFRMSYLLGAALAILPTAPLLAFYVPHRVREIDNRLALRQAIQGRTDPAFAERYLAHRALLELSFNELEALGADPWMELGGRDLRELARAERRRLGLSLDQTT
ncbi:MAG TPA: hypothetical protein VFY10_10445 [Dehalococcoidia bacterium]|nr:hypothetical protein [Dehalococcoidia bacterium]